MRRLITAIGLLALAFYLIFAAPPLVFAAATLCMSLLCYWEYSGIVAGHDIRRPGIYGVVAGLLLLFWQFGRFSPTEMIGVLMTLIVAAFISALRYASLRDILPQVAGALLGAFYTFAPWRFATELRRQSVHLLFFALALNWAGDSAAYYAGRAFGRHKLSPEVSPKKTWEGAIASVLGSLLFGLLYLRHFLPALAWWEIASMAVVGNVAGQFGDLAESAMKRGAGLKDSGTILPGHGGMLDRVDSNLFALPIVSILYFFLRTQS
jgi:phosphatidate cytidylyltransferase